jgi:D-alanyl-lipoteichoic acid acyltransferase DltB (MBOAT superfamily)
MSKKIEKKKKKAKVFNLYENITDAMAVKQDVLMRLKDKIESQIGKLHKCKKANIPGTNEFYELQKLAYILEIVKTEIQHEDNLITLMNTICLNFK